MRVASASAWVNFLVGDAARIHSPIGAQGMNTGMQGTFHLGWKLALVVKGQASERLHPSPKIKSAKNMVL